MCDCDNESPSAYWETRPKAKKRHKCDECRGWIEPGETYLAVRGVWDGDPLSFKQCPDCLDLIEWAKKQSECLCLSFGEVHSVIIEDSHESGDDAYKREAHARIKAIRAKRREAVAPGEVPHV